MFNSPIQYVLKKGKACVKHKKRNLSINMKKRGKSVATKMIFKENRRNDKLDTFNENESLKLIADTQDESLCEGEIGKEELPSFMYTKNGNRFATFNENQGRKIKCMKIEITPVSNLFTQFNSTKDKGFRAELLQNIVKYILKENKLWSTICKLKDKVGNGVYESLLQKPCPSMYVIVKDAERTLTNEPEFQKGEKGYNNLINVLHAISIYRDDVSYLQGMNFIAGSLLKIFDPEESFWVFQFLLTDYRLLEMYTEDMPLLKLFQYQLRTLMEIHLPKINSWFIQNALDVDIICPQWFLTLFSNNDNSELFYRTIDLLFITGTKALFKIALSLLSILYEKGFLENFNFEPELEASLIIEHSNTFKTSNRLLKELEK